MKTFLKEWDNAYQAALRTIPLFDQTQTAKWSQQQKQLFIKLLYHQRGHFDDILWFMGNFAPDSTSKEVILGNIREEFGGHAPSHEQLYLNFAKSHGVNLTYELIDKDWYLPFLQEYIDGILRWFRNQDWDHNVIAFAAIERLDNLDYPALRDVALSFDTPTQGLIFFNVHILATHYDNVAVLDFTKLWNEKSSMVRGVFDFIAEYQLDIWRKISAHVFAYKSQKAVTIQ